MRIVQGIQLSKFILALLSLGIVCIFACKEATEVSTQAAATTVITQAASTEKPRQTEVTAISEKIDGELSPEEFPCNDHLVPIGKRSGWITEDCIPPELIILPSTIAFADCYLVPEAAQAAINLVNEADKNGYQLAAVSCYRSYQYQQQIYERNVREIGEEQTALEVALPGYSEHQLGTTVDISTKSLDFQLTQLLGDSLGGKWLHENASKFGFVLSYPKGFEERTGYIYEPWHFRWVGVALAKLIEESELSVEEYLREIW